MKVVIDTNVFISGIFFNGQPHTILKLWQSGNLPQKWIRGQNSRLVCS